MTDKRSESERVSARPPLPSIAPPTDDIDSEWGADDDIPAPARLPESSATAAGAPPPEPPAAPRASAPPVASLSTPLPAPRLPTPVPAAPRPASSAPPVARASVPAPAPAAAEALLTTASDNPRRKQTLLGLAPVIPSRSEPPVASEQPSAPPIAPSSPPATSSAPPTATASSPPRADNPLRKQTLFGIAPVLPASATPPSTAPAVAAAPTAEQVPADDKPAAAPMPSSPPAGIASSSPFTRDVSAKSVAPPAPRVVPSSTEHDLAALRPKRPRWLLPVAAAALIALGIVGLRRLDHSSVSAPLPPAAPKPAAVVEKQPEPVAAPTPVPSARPVDDEDDAKPDPTTPDAEPLAPPPVAAADGVRKVLVQSDPPGARLFWRGKEVGTTPFTLELQPGEKHSYEMGLPGHVTRKVVIDGSKSEISIGMKPESGVFTGASPRK